MEKITITSGVLNKILDHYRDAVIQKFGNVRVLTQATQLEMDTFLKVYQGKLIKRETMPAWSIPLKLIFDPRRGMIDVIPDEQANLLVLP